MGLLWVLVVVGVVGGVAEENPGLLTMKEGVNLELTSTTWEEQRWKSCRDEEDAELCRKGVLFTAVVLREVRRDGELEVILSVEESLHPHVTFDISLHENVDGAVRVKEGILHTGRLLAREEVTLEANELRRVVLRVGDLQWNMADLVVTAHSTGHSDIKTQRSTRIKKLSSDVEVLVQTDKSSYAPGDTVDYRALVVDRSVDKTPKFAQVILSTLNSSSNHTEMFEGTWLPSGEVVGSAIVRGNFTLEDGKFVGVRVTSNGTSRDIHVEPTPKFNQRPWGVSYTPEWMSVRLEQMRAAYFSQPRVNGRVTLTSKEGIPLEGNCNVTIEHKSGGYPYGTTVTRTVAETTLAVGVSGGKFEFDLTEEVGAFRKKGGDSIPLRVEAKCSHFHSGSVERVVEIFHLLRRLFAVRILSLETLSKGNSSHPQSTVVLHFLVERKDGGSVEEEEPSKGLHVKLLLSEENLERLRPSATEFSLPIPPNGRVRLEFQVNDTPTFRWEDRIRLEVGDAEEEALVDGNPAYLIRTLHVAPVDPAQLIRRGDVVRFRLRSCVHYAGVNAILSSANAIYSTRRFSFSPQVGWLDEVIELTIPQNVTTGSLLLTVYGEYSRSVRSASVPVNVIPSSGPQYIRIVDQVGDDMSTVVTFRLEGMLADSVVSLQGAKLESPEGITEGRTEIEGPLKCLGETSSSVRENAQTEIWDDSPNPVGPNDLHISANFYIFSPIIHSIPPRSLKFIDVDRNTFIEDNGTFTVTKTFDRLTDFGTYVVSGATFNSGRSVFSNSPVLRILPPRVTLGISVPPSVLLGETIEVHGYVKNNLASPFVGHVTLESIGEGSTEVMEELVEIKPNSLKILKLQVTPANVGDLVVSLRSNISSRLTTTKKMKVNPAN